MAASFDLHSVAVLGKAVDRLVIWHVNVGAALGLSRLSGAWVVEGMRRAEVESLTAGFPIVLAEEEDMAIACGGSVGIRTGDHAAADMIPAGGASAVRADQYAPAASSGGVDVIAAATGIVDIDSTVETVRAEIASADARFTDQDVAGGKYIRPLWPVVVPPGEVSLTQSQVDVTDDHIRPVLTLARGLADLADAWAAFESLRLARGFLVDLGGPVARPLPLVVR
ncbi:hypothetical protein [Nocardia sp. NPDC004722]